MGTMTKKLLFVFTILLAVAFVAAAADVSGKWTYEQPGRGGGNPFTVTITLKADGATLTGTVLGGGGGGRGRRGGGGGAPAPLDISDGKVDGDTITFTVKRETQNGTMTTSYKGKLNGDTLELEITRPGRGGGEPVTNKFTAKRAATT